MSAGAVQGGPGPPLSREQPAPAWANKYIKHGPGRRRRLRPAGSGEIRAAAQATSSSRLTIWREG